MLIVQVGTDALMRVGGVDLDLVGKTSMGETAVLLKHSLLLLDGDSGLVHLNHALSGKSVVLFGPTPSAFFGYAENANITSQFCTGCVWMRGTRWHTECLRGFDGPKCLEEITPSTVLEAATAILSGRPSFSYTLAESVVIDGADPVKGLESVLRRHLAGTDKTRCRIAVTGDHDLRAASFLAEQGHTVTSFLEPFGAEKNDHGALSHASVRQAAQCGFSLDFASGLALPLQDNHADFVVCRDVGRDVYYSSYVLKELLRVLQPGGSLIAMAASRASASDERCSSECMEFSRDLMKECAVNMPEHSMAKMACGETASGIVCVITKGVGVHMSAAKPSAFQAGGTV